MINTKMILGMVPLRVVIGSLIIIMGLSSGPLQAQVPTPDAYARSNIWIGPLEPQLAPPASKQLVLATETPTEHDGVGFFIRAFDNGLWNWNTSHFMNGWLGPAHGFGGIDLDGIASDHNEAVVLFGTRRGSSAIRPIIELKAAMVNAALGKPDRPYDHDLVFQLGNYVHFSQNEPLLQVFADGRAFLRTSGYMRAIATAADIGALQQQIMDLEARLARLEAR